MHSWRTVKFQELAAEEPASFAIGPFGSRITKENYVPVGVPVVRGVNLTRGVFVDEDFVYIRDEKADELASSILTTGDLVFTHRGTIGQVSMIPRNPRFERYILSSSQVKARLNPEESVPEFYYYWFRSAVGQRALLANASTVGVPGIASPLSTIRSIEVPHPPRPVQKGIAEVLGALDDKIAVNERIAVASLELADAYFQAEAADLRVGPQTFGEIAGVFGGGTPRTSEPSYWDGDIAWTTPSDVTALRAPYLFDTSRKITQSGLRECASQLYPAGSIFMTSRATIGAFAIPQVPVAVNQGFVVVIPPTEELRWWLFHEMRSRVDEMVGIANGSTFLELSRKNFKSMPVRVPDPDRHGLARFASTVDPLHHRAAKGIEENNVLTELRDGLLPGLMAGAIRVRDAERAVEDAT